MSAVTDVIRLADKLRECQALVDREASLEQACAETQSRLLALRAEEEKARGAAYQARDFLNQQAEGARVQADAIVSAARAAARKATSDAEIASAASKAAGERVVFDLACRRDALQESCSLLEAAESTLGQKVAALQSAFDALRAKLT